LIRSTAAVPSANSLSVSWYLSVSRFRLMNPSASRVLTILKTEDFGARTARLSSASPAPPSAE
jgi:hypothetical protein